MKFRDITGEKINGWTVIRQESRTPDGHIRWLFRCDCGEERIARVGGIKRNARSGCLKCSMSTHGESRTRLNQVWRDMKLRAKGKYGCGDWYDNVGMCSEWESYEPFRDWALANGYEEGLTIDRINSDGDYEPSNCRWATPLQQTINRKATKLNEQAVIAMRYAHYVLGKQQKDIAAIYGLTKSIAGQAIRGDTWKHVQKFN